MHCLESRLKYVVKRVDLGIIRDKMREKQRVF